MHIDVSDDHASFVSTTHSLIVFDNNGMIDTTVVIQDLGDSGRPTGKQTVIEVGTKEDGSILKISAIGDNLYVLKEYSLYELNVLEEKSKSGSKKKQIKKVIQKKVISQGAESIIVAKTFLTAKSVFQHGNFKEDVNSGEADPLIPAKLTPLFAMAQLV